MLGRVRWERSMSVYEAPRLSELGSIRELTQQQFNKVGSSPDMYTPATAGIVIGSLVNPP